MSLPEDTSRPVHPRSAAAAGTGSSESDRERSRELAWKIVDTVREPMLVLDRELRVVRGNSSFYARFRVDPDETIGQSVFELGNGQWNIPRLRRLLEQVLPQNEAFDGFVVEHDFEHLGPRTMLLNARRIDSIERILLAIEDVTDRRRRRRRLEGRNADLSGALEQQLRALRLLQDVTRIANEAKGLEDGVRSALGRICEFNHWHAAHAWTFVDDERAGSLVSTGIWHVEEGCDVSRLREATHGARLAVGEEAAGRVLETGTAFWAEDIRGLDDWTRDDPDELVVRTCAACPVFVRGRIDLVLEFFSLDSLRCEDSFVEVLPELCIQIGHLVARKRLQKEVADRADREQRKIGQELHDGVGQQLSAIGLLAANLRHDLGSEDRPRVDKLDRLIRAIDEARAQLRALTSGILPLGIDPDGLLGALRHLVETTQRGFQIECVLESDPDVRLRDAFEATQLYRIAQEAIHNAVKHAKADRIEVRVCREPQVRILVRDDGVGMDSGPMPRGSGMDIMRFRADLISANFDVQSRPGEGTTVSCTLSGRRER